MPVPWVPLDCSERASCPVEEPMASHPFVRPEARARLKRAVESVEGVSAAEVVVSVQPFSAVYRHVDYLVGAALAFACLAFMLYVEAWAFPLHQFLVGTAACFGVGALASALATPAKRLLVCPAVRVASTRMAAKARFHDLGINRTRDRSGILVYVSLFEGRAAVVPDVGVQDRVPREEWAPLAQALQDAVARGGVGPRGVEALALAIEAMGPPLAKALPRREDDVNELADLAEE